MSERFIPHDSVDWSAEPSREQHIQRYEDQLFHISMMAVVGDINFISQIKGEERWSKLTVAEQERLRHFGIMFRLNNYLAVGGNPAKANEIVAAGNDMHFAPPRYVPEGGSALNLRIPKKFNL